MTKPQPFNWQQFKKYLEKDFGRRLQRDSLEVFKEKTFQGDYKKVAREFCSHCLEINYLLQLFGYEEHLSEKNLKTLIYGFEDYIIHTDINGYGRWTNKAEKLNPEDYHKVYLYKGMVLMEKYKQYGSASPAASVFQELEQSGLVTPELLDWTFKNRNNEYTPFRSSRFSTVKSYKEFVNQYRNDEIITARHLERMESDKEVAQHKKNKIKIDHVVLMTRRKIKNEKLREKVNNYLNTKPDIIDDILNQRLNFPIFLIPNKVVDEIILGLDCLSYKSLKTLCSLIPKHVSPKFKVLKRIVRAKLKKGLPGFLGFLPIREKTALKIKQKEIQRKHYFELHRKYNIIHERRRKSARQVFIKSKGRIELMHFWDKRKLIEKFTN